MGLRAFPGRRPTALNHLVDSTFDPSDLSAGYVFVASASVDFVVFAPFPASVFGRVFFVTPAGLNFYSLVNLKG
jgi:hypothetical protein